MNSSSSSLTRTLVCIRMKLHFPCIILKFWTIKQTNQSMKTPLVILVQIKLVRSPVDQSHINYMVFLDPSSTYRKATEALQQPIVFTDAAEIAIVMPDCSLHDDPQPENGERKGVVFLAYQKLPCKK